MFLFCICLVSSFCFSQKVDSKLYNFSIIDTAKIFNKQFVNITQVNKRKINLQDYKIDNQNYPERRIIFNTTKWENFDLSEKFPDESWSVKIFSYDEKDLYSWSINVDVGNKEESFSVIPIFFDGEYLVLNLISTVKVYKKNKGIKQEFTGMIIMRKVSE